MSGYLILTVLLHTASPVISQDGYLHYMVAGDFSDIAHSKNVLYCASGFGLDVLSAELESISLIPTDNFSHKIAAQGKRIYLGEADRISVFRVTSDGPELSSHYTLPGMLTAVTVNKNYLIAGTESGKLLFFNHSDNLEPFAEIDIEGVPVDFAFYESYLYAASGRAGITTIELGKTPKTVATHKDEDYNAITVDNDLLFAASSQSKIVCYTLENPLSPELKREFAAGSPVISLHAFEKYLYAAQGYDGYSMFTYKGQKVDGPEGIKGFVEEILPTDEGLYLVMRDYGIIKLRGKNPKSLTVTRRYTKTSPSIHISQGGVFWGIAQGRGGARILRLAGDTAITGYANPMPVDARSTDISGSYLYVADAARGVEIFTLKGLPSAEREFDLSQPGAPFRIETSEDFIYVASGAKGVRVLWICPCGPLSQKTLFEDNIYARDIAVKDSLIFAADLKAGIRVFNIWDSTHKHTKLTPLALYEGVVSPQDIMLSGDVLWVADSVGALIALDVSDPLSPRQLSFTLLQTRPYGLTMVDETVYVACGEDGVLPVDVKVPDNPKIGNYIHTPGRALSVAVSADYLGVADYTSVMLIPLDSLEIKGW